MSGQKPNNIKEFVWKIIETDLALKKDISRGLVNMRALASYIISEHKLDTSIDAVISAIRRYHSQPIGRTEPSRVYTMLKQAKIRSVSKIAALTLKKTDEVHRKIAHMLPKEDFTAGELFRVIEGSRIFKIIFDQVDLEKMTNYFGKINIIEANKKIGMVEIIYPHDLEKVPGVFSIVISELADNDISIIDGLICSNEHILIVDDKSILRAFEIIYGLCS